MINHAVKVARSVDELARKDQLAWKIAEVAADLVPVSDEVIEMVINRIIDNAGVSAASVRRSSVVNARAQAISHRASPGSTIFGAPTTLRVSPEWAAWAN